MSSETSRMNRVFDCGATRNLFQNEEGATSIEYSLIAALMAIAVIACLTAFGPQMLAGFNQMGADMATPPNVTAE